MVGVTVLVDVDYDQLAADLSEAVCFSLRLDSHPPKRMFFTQSENSLCTQYLPLFFVFCTHVADFLHQYVRNSAAEFP